MARSVLNMSMSLDGYIAGPNDELGNPGADGFVRLHEWGLTPDGEDFQTTGPAAELLAEVNAAGAIVAGRRTAEQVDHSGGDHHGSGVPIFVPSHRPAGPSVANHPLVSYVSEGIVSAMAQAKAAQGERNVPCRSSSQSWLPYAKPSRRPHAAARAPRLRVRPCRGATAWPSF